MILDITKESLLILLSVVMVLWLVREMSLIKDVLSLFMEEMS